MDVLLFFLLWTISLLFVQIKHLQYIVISWLVKQGYVNFSSLLMVLVFGFRPSLSVLRSSSLFLDSNREEELFYYTVLVYK